MAWVNFGGCLMGTILASLLGLPLVLLHVGSLTALPFGLWIGACGAARVLRHVGAECVGRAWPAWQTRGAVEYVAALHAYVAYPFHRNA